MFKRGRKLKKNKEARQLLEDACDWEMQVDLGEKLVGPLEIASTNLMPKSCGLGVE